MQYQAWRLARGPRPGGRPLGGNAAQYGDAEDDRQTAEWCSAVDHSRINWMPINEEFTTKILWLLSSGSAGRT